MRCEICGRPAVFKCRLCGRSVCREDYDVKRGLCVVCLETLCEICRERLSVGYCRICGKLVCRKCAFKEGPSLVCLSCRQRSLTLEG